MKLRVVVHHISLLFYLLCCILLIGPDQFFLKKYVWPWAKYDAMQHDSYFCKKYSRTRPFPIRRKNETNNFMAAVVAQNQYIWKKCPEKCRPKEHQDWEYC